MANLRKSYSNYVIRRKSQLTRKGSIYERDWMTVSEMNGFPPGSVPVYASGNFKMVINNERNPRKRYSFSNWILNDSGTTDWNSSMIDERKLVVKSQILNPNYSSLLDFAYYGSAVQLIYGSINDIYEKFPAEMFGTDKHLTYYIGNESAATEEFLVENPFNIDVSSHFVKQETVSNPLRYMALSWDKYYVVIDDETYEIKGWYPGSGSTDYCINGDPVFTDVKIELDKCLCGGSGCTAQNKAGRLVGSGDSLRIEAPMGNDSDNYIPKLQDITHDTHEYNYEYNDDYALERLDCEPKNLTGSVISGESLLKAKIPVGNDAEFYCPNMQEIEYQTHEYNYQYNEETALDRLVCSAITLSAIYVNGKIYILSDISGWHLRLKDEYVDSSFDMMDDFEKVLLNRDTKPKYKATLYTPTETETGVIVTERAYIWPTLLGGWNLDMETGAYESYVNGLLEIATYYDEYRTDNIWRSYTHESIKNFDWTTPRETYVPEIDNHLIDTERMEAIMKVCGRQFDDIKRYIENIRFTVNVSYDSKNNMPDTALAKFLEMSGWEVKNVSPVDDNTLTVINEYPGITVKNTPEEANNEFLKRMILNSRNILSKKGTRAGIEAVYSMFGLFEKRFGGDYYYTIDEYDVFTNDYIYDKSRTDTPYTDIVTMNQQKNGFEQSEYYTSADTNGLMCKHMIDIGEISYMVPWYDRYEVYDGNAYYQMMGGWGKRERKKIYVPDLSTGTTELHSVEGEFEIYDETVKYIRLADDFKNLNMISSDSVEIGDIYYVLNMLDAYNKYGCEYTNDSHYVVFLERIYIDELGAQFVPYSDDYGWLLVSMDEFNVPESGMSWYAKKILYMESIHDIDAGNNPHKGNGKYDGGKEYLEFYKQLFKGAFDNDMFSEYKVRIQQENSRRHYENRFRAEKMLDLEDKSETVRDIGFDLTDLTVDNEKVWFFLSFDAGLYQGAYDEDQSPSVLHKRKSGGNYELVTNEDFPLVVESSETWGTPIWNTGSTITTPGASLNIPEAIKAYYGTEYQPDDTSSYSVINVKNLKITYHLPWELEDYVTDVVEFYVKQMIPSTAILEFVWDYTDGPRPPEESRYSAINLVPSYQSIRASESSAEIGISSSNVEGIVISTEGTETR